MVGQAGQAAGSACAKGGGRPRRRAAFGRRKRETRGSALRLPGSEGQTRASERARGGDKDEIDGLTFFLDERRLLRGLIPGFVSPLMLERVRSFFLERRLGDASAISAGWERPRPEKQKRTKPGSGAREREAHAEEERQAAAERQRQRQAAPRRSAAVPSKRERGREGKTTAQRHKKKQGQTKATVVQCPPQLTAAVFSTRTTGNVRRRQKHWCGCCALA